MINVYVVTSMHIGGFHDNLPEVFLDRDSADTRHNELCAQNIRSEIREVTAKGALKLFVLNDPKSIPEVYTTRALAEAQKHIMLYPSIDEVEVDKEYPDEY